jgi:hypothetical protein
MPRKKLTPDEEPKRLLETDLDENRELVPGDVRKHMLGAFDILLNIALDETDPHRVFSAVKGIDSLYTTLVMATRTDELLTKNDHNNKDILREVKKRRRPDWMGEGGDEEEN